MHISPDLGWKLGFVLGITNLVGLALVFFSCRCLMGNRLTAFFWSKTWYRTFYRFHCYFWWFLFLSVTLHAVLGLFVFGYPF